LKTQIGGSIRNPKKKSPKKDRKIEEALQTQVGGSIRNARKKSPKKNKKVREALKTQIGGGIRFHSTKHKWLYNNLSGRGGRLDSPQVRQHMYDLMKQYDGNLFKTYLHGKVVDRPRFIQDEVFRSRKPNKQDSSAHVIDYGGSLNSITHSEDGLLTAHNNEFFHLFEIV